MLVSSCASANHTRVQKSASWEPRWGSCRHVSLFQEHLQLQQTVAKHHLTLCGGCRGTKQIETQALSWRDSLSSWLDGSTTPLGMESPVSGSDRKARELEMTAEGGRVGKVVGDWAEKLMWRCTQLCLELGWLAGAAGSLGAWGLVRRTLGTAVRTLFYQRWKDAEGFGAGVREYTTEARKGRLVRRSLK